MSNICEHLIIGKSSDIPPMSCKFFGRSISQRPDGTPITHQDCLFAQDGLRDRSCRVTRENFSKDILPTKPSPLSGLPLSEQIRRTDYPLEVTPINTKLSVDPDEGTYLRNLKRYQSK